MERTVLSESNILYLFEHKDELESRQKRCFNAYFCSDSKYSTAIVHYVNRIIHERTFQSYTPDTAETFQPCQVPTSLH